MFRKFSPVIFVCLFFAAVSYAQTLNEKQTTFEIANGSAMVNLAINSRSSATSVPIKLELIDPNEKLRASAVQNFDLKTGMQIVTVPVLLGDILSTEDELLGWFRLRYDIGGEGGIIPLSDIFRDDFTLRISASEYISAGTTYRILIDSLNPATQEPAGGVRVEAVLSVPGAASGKDIEIRRSGITAADGSLYLDLPVGSGINIIDSATVKVSGFRNGLTRTAEEDLEHMEIDMSFIMMNDKTIYQPGQIVHTRGILLNGTDEMTVAAGRDIELRVEDEDDKVLFRQVLKTSDFGVANADWEIPKNAKLGNYSLTARVGERIVTYKWLKVSRYDLPNFIVAAKPDKAYYLPGQNIAKVTVNADYLFGKPVTKGKVRVVEELNRDWNWKEQRYDIKEGDVSEGETDVSGVFVATFDISDDLEEFEKDDDKDKAGFSDRRTKYDDLHFTAYFTDPTTNRTEQKRFDIRITDQPIHVYYTSYNDDDNRTPELPDDAFLAAYYADGSPAECDIEVMISPEDQDKYEPLTKIRTNKYGIASLSYMRPAYGDKTENVDLRYRAVDANGMTGAYKTSVYFDDDEDAVHFKTDKAIYKRGENIGLSMISNIKEAGIVVQVVRGHTIIDTHRIKLSGGKADLTIPYNETFRGILTIFVFDPSNEDLSAAHSLIYPMPSNLKITAAFDKTVYKPGDDAKLSFSVIDANGNAAETALGVTIFDKAVDARKDTDGGYSAINNDFYRILGSREAFSEIDLTKPIPDDLQLATKRRFSDIYYSDANIFGSENYNASTLDIFQKYFDRQFKPIGDNLNLHYRDNISDHPTDAVSLKRILAVYGQDLDTLRDPWGEQYFVKFGISKKYDTVIVFSKGIDKIKGTDDDLTAYSGSFESFTEMGKAINAAIQNYHERTGGFIRDQATLFAELGITEMIDPFGRPYYLEFYTNYTRYVLSIKSLGADGVKAEYWYSGDDFEAWKADIDYGQAIRAKIENIIRESGKKPGTSQEFETVLEAGGLPFAKIRDGYDRPTYITTKSGSRYSERAKIVNQRRYGDDKNIVTTVITPVTEDYVEFDIRSNGSDAKEGTYDDFTLAKTTVILAEHSAEDKISERSIYFGNGGAITGVVKDSAGALVPAISIRIYGVGFLKTIVANDSGYFSITGLPPGTYEVSTLPSGGFAQSQITNIVVTLRSRINIEITVFVSEEGNSVNVSSGDAAIETTGSSMSVSKSEGYSVVFRSPVKPKVKTDGPIAGLTPRLREYFPETLLWMPELVTGANGKITTNFKMADNITTWKMYAVASDKAGNIGLAESETTAFQSFFVDLDPPKFLTQGDEISLPVQVRNYTDSAQNAKVSMTKTNWFSFIGKDNFKVNVSAGKTENAVFSFRADKFIDEGKQRVTAIAGKVSDAIEKPVTVRPDGFEVVRPESKVFNNRETFHIDFPETAIKDTPHAELRIYPNLFSHVTEAVDGLLQRPYGCGEQTISSTYPNLMILKAKRPNEALAARALKNLQDGYDRLLGYQATTGGFTYWGGNSTPDIALTAYAIRFLNDAKSFIAVDENIIENAEDWLLKQQKPDGGWVKELGWQADNERGERMLTTYVVRSLAMMKPVADSPKAKALASGFQLIHSYNDKIGEPYSMALYGLASLDTGNAGEASRMADELAVLAIKEGDGEYWSLETNTPFYGWGTPGRVETTAMVLQLLSRVDNKKYHERISKGLIFLLKKKDRYGVWYSTQTTINVLDTLIALTAADESSSTNTIRISINGKPLKTFTVTPDQIEQQTVDLTAELTPTENTIEIESDASSLMMAQAVLTHYVRWESAETSVVVANKTRALDLKYTCDKTTAAIMEEITCSVGVERVGFKGYGMLLAEIGTPPGADIDRESLQRAIDTNRAISRFDILPDRIVIYMFARPGGNDLTFKFRPRYAINAQTPASTAYDYYNPEASATVDPIRFRIGGF